MRRSRTRSWLQYGSEFLGISWLQLEAALLLVAIAVWLFLSFAGSSGSFLSTLTFSLFIGNWAAGLINLGRPLFTRLRQPWSWIVFIILVVVVGVSGSILADVAVRAILGRPKADLFGDFGPEIPIGTLVTLIFGVVSYIYFDQKGSLESQNRELQGQVHLGQVKEQSHEAELAQAHEIQRHLLPRETPQIPGFQIACAWQPAKSVSGDYFDVLPLGDGRLALCIADVAGKGITAALLMANLQASVKAFALEAASPAVLCAKLNSVLCDSVAPGKFVTLFYGVIDTQQRRLQYENAGHCLPLLVHADGSILMPASYSGVLGLFSHWTFQNSEVQLEAGDCLVLMTDGVLEAANRHEEEFGYQRLIDVVQAKRGSGVHGVRTAILEAVSAFCEGEFDDDASLIVATVN
jgi:phosphoserine phosphatase RsbU/P